MRLRIWHFFFFILLAAIVARFFIRSKAYPIATAQDASRVNAFTGKLVEIVGDKNGPFRLASGYVESMPAHGTAPLGSRQLISYTMNGQRKVYNIPTNDAFSTHVNVFENPAGNHLLTVFETPWSGSSP